MIKTKYYYDPESLSYKKIKVSKAGIIKTVAFYLVPILIVNCLICVVILSFFSTPKELLLKKEIGQLSNQYKNIEEKIFNAEKELEKLYEKELTSRIILESKPMHEDIRKAGYGGTNLYEKFEKFNSSELMIDISKKTDQIIKKLSVQSKSFDEIINLAKDYSNKIRCIPAIQPISNKDLSRISSGFGYRIDPHYGIKKMHTGTDFAAPRGTPVYATGNGQVIKAENKVRGGYGKNIIIDHGYGYKTQYAHLNRLAVKEGQKVKRGELIGYVGSTGKSTSPHLHYEVHLNDKKVNPINYFYNDLTIEEYDEMRKICSQENQSFD